jgi:hypothetical protein
MEDLPPTVKLNRFESNQGEAAGDKKMKSNITMKTFLTLLAMTLGIGLSAAQAESSPATNAGARTQDLSHWHRHHHHHYYRHHHRYYYR